MAWIVTHCYRVKVNAQFRRSYTYSFLFSVNELCWIICNLIQEIQCLVGANHLLPAKVVRFQCTHNIKSRQIVTACCSQCVSICNVCGFSFVLVSSVVYSNSTLQQIHLCLWPLVRQHLCILIATFTLYFRDVYSIHLPNLWISETSSWIFRKIVDLYIENSQESRE